MNKIISLFSTESLNFFIDAEILIDHGITDLEKYAVDPSVDLYNDFFL